MKIVIWTATWDLLSTVWIRGGVEGLKHEIKAKSYWESCRSSCTIEEIFKPSSKVQALELGPRQRLHASNRESEK